MVSRSFCVGLITSAHGVRGEVKIRTYLDSPTLLPKLGLLSDKDGQIHLKITRCRTFRENTVIAEIENIDDRSRAEMLRGQELYVARDKLPPVDKDEYYCSDLVGLPVENELGKRIGTVEEIFDFGAGNVIEIKQADTEETIMLPFHREFFPVVELNKRLVASLPKETKS